MMITRREFLKDVRACDQRVGGFVDAARCRRWQAKVKTNVPPKCGRTPLIVDQYSRRHG